MVKTTFEYANPKMAIHKPVFMPSFFLQLYFSCCPCYSNVTVSCISDILDHVKKKIPENMNYQKKYYILKALPLLGLQCPQNI